jgi:hypothetical protein
MRNKTEISNDILVHQVISRIRQSKTVAPTFRSPPRTTKACRAKFVSCDRADHCQPQLNPLFGPLLKGPMGDCELCRFTVRAIKRIHLQRGLEDFNYVSTKEYFNGSEHAKTPCSPISYRLMSFLQ